MPNRAAASQIRGSTGSRDLNGVAHRPTMPTSDPRPTILLVTRTQICRDQLVPGRVLPPPMTLQGVVASASR
jgi:hypothetical protein